jgi:hypothetical protein
VLNPASEVRNLPRQAPPILPSSDGKFCSSLDGGV